MVLQALGLFVRLLTFLGFRVLRALRLFVRFLTIFFRFMVWRALRRLLILSSVCHSDSFVERGGVESGVLIRVVTTVDYKLKGREEWKEQQVQTATTGIWPPLDVQCFWTSMMVTASLSHISPPMRSSPPLHAIPIANCERSPMPLSVFYSISPDKIQCKISGWIKDFQTEFFFHSWVFLLIATVSLNSRFKVHSSSVLCSEWFLMLLVGGSSSFVLWWRTGVWRLEMQSVC